MCSDSRTYKLNADKLFPQKDKTLGQQRRKVENVNEQVDFNFSQEGVSEYAEIGWAK